MTRIALLDYGMGNLRSVAKALERVGASVDLVGSLDGVVADGLVVPGQGAFGTCRVDLDATGSAGALSEWISGGRPYLGICLGLQILFADSAESPGTHGLGLVGGRVTRLRGDIKIPHIGWNQVRFSPDAPVFAGLTDDTYFYFDHSYAPADAADAAAWTDYGQTFCCGIARGATVAVQFHPEKSGDAGLHFLENFVKGSVA